MKSIKHINILTAVLSVIIISHMVNRNEIGNTLFLMEEEKTGFIKLELRSLALL